MTQITNSQVLGQKDTKFGLDQIAEKTGLIFDIPKKHDFEVSYVFDDEGTSVYVVSGMMDISGVENLDPTKHHASINNISINGLIAPAFYIKDLEDGSLITFHFHPGSKNTGLTDREKEDLVFVYGKTDLSSLYNDDGRNAWGPKYAYEEESIKEIGDVVEMTLKSLPLIFKGSDGPTMRIAGRYDALGKYYNGQYNQLWRLVDGQAEISGIEQLNRCLKLGTLPIGTKRYEANIGPVTNNYVKEGIFFQIYDAASKSLISIDLKGYDKLRDKTFPFDEFKRYTKAP